MQVLRPLPNAIGGVAVGLLALAVALAVLVPTRSQLDTATAALVLVLPGVAAALVGSRWSSLVIAVLSAVVFNVGFLRPYGTLKIDLADEIIDLVVFTGVALVVGTLVARSEQRRRAAEARTAEVEALDRENAAIRERSDRLAAETLGLALAGEHRSALLRAVSHDLRTPLATIRAVSSDLRSNPGYDGPTRDELLDLVADEAERLDRLVANLLSMSRTEAGALVPELQAVPLEELFDECARRQARLLRDRRLSVDVPLTLPLVDADWTLVEQVVTNLLANAVRHSSPGDRISLTARRRGDAWVEVTVGDQGPGIPPALREEVFTPFRRGPGSASSGVGLAIAKAVVEAHGGTIGIGEAPGGGALVSFTLPVHGA